MFGDQTWDVVAKDLEGLSRRFEAASENMANANTPRYARKQVGFEEQLREALGEPDRLPMEVTDDLHIANTAPSVRGVAPSEARVYDEVYRLDGNNVDPERENALIAQTRMTYQAMSRLLARKKNAYNSVMGR